MPSYSLSPLAYLKLVLHAAAYPSSTVVGVLLGTVDDRSTGAVTVSDAVPLLHHWSELSPAMEAGLALAETFAKQQGAVLVGLYVANERLGDVRVPHGVQRAADAVRSQCAEALVLVVDNDKLASGEPAIIPHLPSSKPPASWQPSSLSSAKLTLADPASPTKALAAVREGQHRLVGDFDAHLEDVTVDWLRNARISV
ncbi:hypothetical protein JCM3775_001306 [Rhodotorula graminis]|uniref:MPN domain-containing protein n=1 Tax=Rhodotorula graminis (strain WP1) TaxID=578459 RepID=A0A194SD87_RHOGW|nr:uncharacterized protein RHOBADRAFT_40950 [Rhodotorula graminis WP1]KPV78405.1 hypothetical protein RHOBADRAFT_40950 [Rhodotorula graminis WP1]